MDESISRKYWELSQSEREYLHSLYKDPNTASEKIKQLQSVLFKLEPPTAKQFLDPQYGWIRKPVADSIYDHVKQDFIDIIDGSRKYLQVVNYGSTRQGKTFLSRLLIQYIMVWCHCLREPSMYYNLSPLTHLAIYLLAFKYEKTHQLLMKPIWNLLESSERFIKVDRQDLVKIRQKEVGPEYIVYSKASSVGQITLDSGLQIMLGNDDPLSIIGADVIAMFVSEIAFFIENAGATEEQIFRLYSDGLERMTATVGNAPMSFIYLDTSANYAESVIENYILTDLRDRDDVFFRARSRWEARPHLYPKWQKTGETFKVCTGNGSTPAKIITHDDELESISPELIVEVPIDCKDDFERNLLKAIKDIIGKPTTSESKLITDTSLIERIFEVETLRNHSSSIVCDAAETNQTYLWDHLKDIIFIRPDTDSYRLQRAPREPRWLGFDLAHSKKGDLLGLSMVHKEYFTTALQVGYVTDFSFCLAPGINGINIDLIKYLVNHLQNRGNVHIAGIMFDTFQSESLAQYFLQNNFPYSKNSVDRSTEPYQYLFGLILSGLLKAGKNIFLKNNLRSLQNTKHKNGLPRIDHTYGKTYIAFDGNWNLSNVGVNAKDCSDSLTQAVWGAAQDQYLPQVSFEAENHRLNPMKVLTEANKQELISGAYNSLHRKIGLPVSTRH